jgi:hypothetical protein
MNSARVSVFSFCCGDSRPAQYEKMTGGESHHSGGSEHLSNMAMLRRLERMGHGDMTVHCYRMHGAAKIA